MRAEDILSENQTYADVKGVTVRKGSVAAFLANASILLDPNTTAAAREEAEGHIRESNHALKALGLFDILEIRDPELRALVASM